MKVSVINRFCYGQVHIESDQIEQLKGQQQRMVAERASLDLEEARLLSPEKLEELAKSQEFIDPAPDQVVFLPPLADGSLAKVTNSK